MQVAAAGYIRLIQARLERILDATLLLFEVLYGSSYGSLCGFTVRTLSGAS